MITTRQLPSGGCLSKMFNTMKTIVTKFVAHKIPELQTLQDTEVYQLREKLNNGKKMNRAEKNWLAEALIDDFYFKKAVPMLGWKFDFEDVLKTYAIKQHGIWREYSAPDKTSLRMAIYGTIDHIIEIKK